MSKKPNFIAVYGTLRKGFRAESKMADCKQVGDLAIKGAMFDLGSYPGVKLKDTSRKFFAEVYRLPTDEELRAEVIERLDAYEAEGFLYDRVIVQTKFGPTYVYEYKGEIVGREPFFKWG